jgi:membrane protein
MQTEPEPSAGEERTQALSESDFLRQEAQTTRAAIQATLRSLQKDARQALDARAWVRRFPGSATLLSLSAGFGAGWAIIRRHKRRRQFHGNGIAKTHDLKATERRRPTPKGGTSVAALIVPLARWMTPALQSCGLPRSSRQPGFRPPAPSAARAGKRQPHDRDSGNQRQTRFESQAPGGSWWEMLKQTVSDWLKDKAPRLGAALAYYTIFSLAPLLVIALAIAGMFLGADAVRGELHGQLQSMLGDSGAAAVEEMVAAASKPTEGVLATVIGIAVLLFGASGVFGQLQDALNTIWDVEPKPRGIWGTIKDRFFSFAMVLGTGFLLLVSLVLSAAINLIGGWMSSILPLPEFVLQAVNFVASFAVVTLLFAAIFKLLPDAVVAWKDVWIGAIVTAALFVIGKFLLGMYLGRGSVANAYGAVGSLVVVLVWVYYSAQIVFFGAEFTQVYARTRGSHIKPAPDALPTTDRARAEQGMRPKEPAPA